MNVHGYKTRQITDFVWEIPLTEKKGMVVPARIYSSEKLFSRLDEGVFDQITNVACLPGLQKYAIALPDAHFGYGAPVGAVGAFDINEGIISPGKVGFDINCGMRLLTTNLTGKEVQPKIRELVNDLFERIPAGVGKKGRIKVQEREFRDIVEEGARWCLSHGMGWDEDIKKIEEQGCIKKADAHKVSAKAIKRGIKQLGTLGSGNHYLEVQIVHANEIYDAETARAFGIHSPNQVVVMLHTGSRGFGHQIATDYLNTFEPAMKKYNITVPDRQLACAPFASEEGQDYYKAMACAANNAYANRQVITHNVRESFAHIFKRSAESMEIKVVYDVAHNIAKEEKHKIFGKTKKVLVHRKGATRAFGPNHPELWKGYKKYGQPVIVGGSMETGSWLLAGTERAMEETFGSTLHGSGRTMSRTKAKKEVKGRELQQKMEHNGIYVKTASYAGLAEEAGLAYKPISAVVDAVHNAGISRKVCGLKPMGNIKG